MREELDHVEGKLKKLVKAADKVKSLEELSREVLGLKEKLLSLEEELREYDGFVFDIYVDLVLIVKAGRLKMSRCKYYRDGYCCRWRWTERLIELDDDEIKVDKLNDRTVYRVRVGKRPVLRAVCPYFEEDRARHRWEPLEGAGVA